MQNIKANDLVRDEYGNYYEVVGVHMDGETLKALEVSNLYFETSFRTAADSGSLGEEYKDKPIGIYLQEQMNAYISDVQAKERPIYGIRDLMVNRIKVYAVDITQPHPMQNHII